LERLAGQAPGAVLPVAEPQPGNELQAPHQLLPVLTAVLAGDDAGGVATALGFPARHRRRGLVMAIMNGVAAVCRPAAALPGLSTSPRPSAAVQRRGKQFFEEHLPLCVMATFADVNVATIIQSLARELRASSDLRARRGKRFLDELAQLWLASLSHQ